MLCISYSLRFREKQNIYTTLLLKFWSGHGVNAIATGVKWQSSWIPNLLMISLHSNTSSLFSLQFYSDLIQAIHCFFQGSSCWGISLSRIWKIPPSLQNEKNWGSPLSKKISLNNKIVMKKYWLPIKLK